MSINYANYSQYLGSQKCCNIRTQGPQGIVGPAGPAGIGPRGWTGMTGEGFTGPSGMQGPAGSGVGVTMIGGYNVLGSQPTQTLYLACFGAGSTFGVTVTNTETDAIAIIPFDCILSNFYAYLSGSIGPQPEKSYTLTIRKNQVNTSLIITISGSNVQGSDTTNSVSFSQGDQITISLVPSGGAAQAAIRWTCKCVNV